MLGNCQTSLNMHFERLLIIGGELGKTKRFGKKMRIICMFKSSNIVKGSNVFLTGDLHVTVI